MRPVEPLGSGGWAVPGAVYNPVNRRAWQNVAEGQPVGSWVRVEPGWPGVWANNVADSLMAV